MKTSFGNKGKINRLKVIVVILGILVICFSGYVVYSIFNNVKFIESSSMGIDDSRKTFSTYDSDGKLIKTSKEYKEVLSIDWDIIAVIDSDDYIKIINEKEKVLATFKDKYTGAKYETSTILFSKPNLVRFHFTETKNSGKKVNIDYCYDKETGKTFINEC